MKQTGLEAGQGFEHLLFPLSARSGQPSPLPPSQRALAHPTGQLSKLDLCRVAAFSYSITSAGQAKAFEKQKSVFCIKYLTKTDCVSL